MGEVPLRPSSLPGKGEVLVSLILPWSLHVSRPPPLPTSFRLLPQYQAFSGALWQSMALLFQREWSLPLTVLAKFLVVLFIIAHSVYFCPLQFPKPSTLPVDRLTEEIHLDLNLIKLL